MPLDFETAQTLAPSIVQGGAVSYGDDDQLDVFFYRNLEADCDFVRVRIPGDKQTEIDTKAKDHHKRRWPRQWAAYEAGRDQSGGGTALGEWGVLTEGTCIEYNAKNIFTVEQLASVSDANLHNLGHSARSLRDRAVKWIEQHVALGENEKLKAELAETKERLTEATETLASMNERLAALERVQTVTPPPPLPAAPVPSPSLRRGPGRPRKTSA